MFHGVLCCTHIFHVILCVFNLVCVLCFAFVGYSPGVNMIDLFIDIARQHLSYGDCLRLRWNIIRTAFCWIM